MHTVMLLEYSYGEYTNDLCLVLVDKPIRFTKYIVPVCLPVAGTEAEVGSKAIATGWGETSQYILNHSIN